MRWIARMRARLQAESGWALVTALVLMTVMVGGGLATYSLVDTQTGASAEQRERESAFNLAEAALNAEVFALARDWPGKGMANNQYPVCTPATGGSRCPSAAQLSGALPTTDARGATWSVQVRDNGSAATQGFYRDDLVTAQPGYDANGDGKVWVRASATAQGKKRTIVALVRAEETPEDIPHAALVTGRLEISNMGNKTIVDAGNGGLVAVRCTPTAGESSVCLGHSPDNGKVATIDQLMTFLQTQIAGVTPVTGYAGAPAMTADAKARLKATAIADGTYYTSCPSSLAGRVVYIEGGNCSYTGNSAFNSETTPGFVLQASGSLYLGGTVDFYGVIYNANAVGSTGWAIQVQGNATIHGGVLVDGPATTVAGSSKENIIMDDDAYDAVQSYGSAGVIQNTWREIRG
jgi:Tfp pilus assembly protein PilX